MKEAEIWAVVNRNHLNNFNLVDAFLASVLEIVSDQAAATRRKPANKIQHLIGYIGVRFLNSYNVTKSCP